MKTIDIAPQTMLAGAGILVVVYLLWKARKAAEDAAGAVVDTVGFGLYAVNPTNPDNIFTEVVNIAGGAVISPTGQGRNADGSWTLGGWVFDVFNPDTAQAVKDATR
jgi:hypothetical protein